MRNSALERALSVAGRLYREPETLGALADLHHVHPRTIRRDLEALKAAGLDVQHEVTGTGPGVWWIERMRRSA